jgi:sucrose-6-phosphate hydrolase SacC (GH32 family)
VIGYDVAATERYVDLHTIRQTGFNRDLPAVQRAPLTANNGEVRLRILVDWSSVEVFTEDGHRVITDQIFPQRHKRRGGTVSRGRQSHGGLAHHAADAFDLAVR